MKFTRENVTRCSGYDAAKAKELLNKYPTAAAVIVSDVAITKRTEGRELAYVKGGRLDLMEPGGTIYYRKSSGGKWGRSVSMFVLLPWQE